MRDHTTVIQRKTGRPVRFEITEQTRASIRDWLRNVDTRHGRHLFPSRFRAQPRLSTRQYSRIVHAWVASPGLDSSAYGTHSMRRTKAAQIYKKTGNLRAVSAFARTHAARKHCPLPRHRGRGRAQHLRAGRTLTYIGALPWRGVTIANRRFAEPALSRRTRRSDRRGRNAAVGWQDAIQFGAFREHRPSAASGFAVGCSHTA